MNLSLVNASAKLLIGIAITLGIISCTINDKPPKADLKPNIIFIITDDHAYQALSAYSNALIETPNIDRLANEGMLFNRAFVTNSICSPSRAVALTGKFSHLNSVRDNQDVFDTTQITFPILLRNAGYETAVYGKWHLKSEPQGFDFWDVLPDQGDYYHPIFRSALGLTQDTGYVTDLITEKSIQYLDTLRDRSKPFFLMYNHKAPHRQWWPSMDDIAALSKSPFPVPETLFDDYDTRSEASATAEMRISDHMALSADNKVPPEVLDSLGYEEFMDWYKDAYTYRLNRLTDDERVQWQNVYGPINADFKTNSPQGQALTLWKYQRYLEDYLGTIKSVDRNMGRLLDYLDDNNLTENTVVVYTSDQGFFLGEHGWFDKRFMYEESFRTPLLIRYPGAVKPGSVNSDLVQNIDFAPTMLELAGTPVPEDMQGNSMVPLFAGLNSNWRDAVYYHYYEYPGIHTVKRHYGIRTKQYKLIRFYYDIEAWELFDLDADPQETNNVYGQPEYADVQKYLHSRLEGLRAQYQDSDSLNQYWIAYDLERSEKD